MIDKKPIRDFLENLVGKGITFTDEDSLITSQMIDSINVAQLIVFLQDAYGIVFENEELIPDNLDSINAIVRILESKHVEVCQE